MTSGQSGFNTQIQTMDSAATRVDEVNNDITRLLGSVRGSVEQLSGSVWQGSAQVRFQSVMNEWQLQSRKLNEALAGISESITANRASFDTTDDDASSAINRVASSGPLNI